MSDVKVILFDAGNTLVWVDHPFLIELLREHGLDFTSEELLEAEYTAKRMMDEMVRSDRPGNDASRGRLYFARVLQELGVQEAHFPVLSERLEARHAERNLWTLVRPGTAEALEELQARGYRLGVISNSDGRVAALLESVGLARYFEFILDSAVVGIEKPDPRIFHLGCEQVGVRPEEAVYVGDIYEIDVVGARGVGMRTFLIDPLGRHEGLECERIAGVHELPARLGNGVPGR